MSRHTQDKQNLRSELANEIASISTRRSQLLQDAKSVEARIDYSFPVLDEMVILGLLNLVQSVKKQLDRQGIEVVEYTKED